jgi:hypothetical protein
MRSGTSRTLSVHLDDAELPSLSQELGMRDDGSARMRRTGKWQQPAEPTSRARPACPQGPATPDRIDVRRRPISGGEYYRTAQLVEIRALGRELSSALGSPHRENSARSGHIIALRQTKSSCSVPALSRFRRCQISGTALFLSPFCAGGRRADFVSPACACNRRSSHCFPPAARRGGGACRRSQSGAPCAGAGGW